MTRSNQPNQDAPAPAARKRVLIADDDGPMCEALRGRLKTLCVDVTTAHDAAHALFLMHRAPPDLAILDVDLPAGNGLAVCEMMRDDARLCEVPVIVLTGDTSDEVRARVEALGAHHVAKGAPGGVWRALAPLCRTVLIPSRKVAS